MLHLIASDNNLLGTSFQKPARGPFGAKPAVASAFIGVSILMDAEALAGFAMPARALAFDKFLVLLNTNLILSHADARKGFGFH